MFSKKKNILSLVILLLWNLYACTGAGPVASPLTQEFENTATKTSDSSNPSSSKNDKTTPSEDSSTEGDIAPISILKLNPPAQPTQPLTPQLGLIVEGIVLLPSSQLNSKCETNFENIPTVKSWVKEPGENWKLNYILGKYESEEDIYNPYIVNQCGVFTAKLDLTLGPPKNPCSWGNSEVKLSAHYRDSQGFFYNGEIIYSCHDMDNHDPFHPEIIPTEYKALPKAVIQLKEVQMMNLPRENKFFP